MLPVHVGTVLKSNVLKEQQKSMLSSTAHHIAKLINGEVATIPDKTD